MSPFYLQLIKRPLRVRDRSQCVIKLRQICLCKQWPCCESRRHFQNTRHFLAQLRASTSYLGRDAREPHLVMPSDTPGDASKLLLFCDLKDADLVLPSYTASEGASKPLLYCDLEDEDLVLPSGTREGAFKPLLFCDLEDADLVLPSDTREEASKQLLCVIQKIQICFPFPIRYAGRLFVAAPILRVRRCRFGSATRYVRFQVLPQQQNRRECLFSERELKKALRDTLTRAAWYG